MNYSDGNVWARKGRVDSSSKLPHYVFVDPDLTDCVYTGVTFVPLDMTRAQLVKHYEPLRCRPAPRVPAHIEDRPDLLAIRVGPRWFSYDFFDALEIEGSALMSYERRADGALTFRRIELLPSSVGRPRWLAQK